MSTSTETDIEQLFSHDTDDSRLTHIVNCPEDKDSAQAWVDEARANGLECTALCGHVWVPQSDPIRHPVCVTCMDIAQVRLS